MRRGIVGGLIGLFAVAGIALSLPTFPSIPPVPNINNIPGNSTVCQTCHINPDGGLSSLNPFGATVRANLTGGLPDWSKIWNIDSDGDGFTNGQELLDPTGQWRPGQPNPGTASAVTHPGNAMSKPSASVRRVTTPTAWAAIKALFR